jgi:hypothetical protein
MLIIRLSNDSVNPRPVSQRLCGHTRKTGYRPCLQTAGAGGARLAEFAREARVHRQRKNLCALLAYSAVAPRNSGWLRVRRESDAPACRRSRYGKNAPKEPTDYRHAKSRQERLAQTPLTPALHGAMCR